MNERLRNFIETLFEDAPKTKEAVELKEEMIQNLIDKYEDLISQGKSSESAYNIVTASVGNIDELVEQLTKPDNHDHYQKEAIKARKINAILTTAAIVLYIFSIIPVLWLQDERGIILMFVIAAIATGMIVYGNLSKPKYLKKEGTVVEEFKEWQQNDPKNKQLYKAINSAMWSLIVVIYFVVSFFTGAWYITWIIFLIGGAIESIIKAIFEMKN